MVLRLGHGITRINSWNYTDSESGVQLLFPILKSVTIRFESVKIRGPAVFPERTTDFP